MKKHTFLRNSKYLLIKILYIINCIIPKQKNKVFAYCSNRNDNAKAMIKYLKNKKDIKVVSDMLMDDTFKKIKIVTNPLTIYLYFFTSEIIFLHLDLRWMIKPTKKQQIIQLWHGSPLKDIKVNSKYKRADFFSKLLYTAPCFHNVMKMSFGCKEEQMLLAGQPRCDWLFSNEKDKAINEICEYEVTKYIVWLPTFRSFDNGENYEFLSVVNSHNICLLDNFLQKTNINIVIKLHPVLQSNYKIADLFSKTKKFIFLTDALLEEKNIELYEFLSKSSALLTDYSSVYFDYLLLNRPIGFTVDDMDEYGENRGFTVENPFDIMPGMKIKTADDLQTFIEDVAKGNDEFAADRKRVCDLTNTYQNGGFCKRIAELCFGQMQDE